MTAAAGLVWIASYPKSGNTWVRCLIDSLAQGGAAAELAALHRRYPWSADRLWLEAVTEMPTSDLTAAELTALLGAARRALGRQAPIARLAAPGVRFLKVHDRYGAETFPGEAAAVYITRDPRDIAPSMADHAGITLDEAIRLLGDSGHVLARTVTRPARGAEERLGSWSDHVAAWLDGFPGPLLRLRYEDLVARPVEQTGRLARFLGLPDDARTVAAAAAANSFARLRAEEERSDFIERGERQRRFFRRGEAGAWAEDLAPEQAAALVARHGPMMARLGYSENGAVQAMASAMPTSPVTRNPSRS